MPPSRASPVEPGRQRREAMRVGLDPGDRDQPRQRHVAADRQHRVHPAPGRTRRLRSSASTASSGVTSRTVCAVKRAAAARRGSSRSYSPPRSPRDRRRTARPGAPADVLVQFVGAPGQMRDDQDDDLAQLRLDQLGAGDRIAERALRLEKRRRGVRAHAHDVERRSGDRPPHRLGQRGVCPDRGSCSCASSVSACSAPISGTLFRLLPRFKPYRHGTGEELGGRAVFGLAGRAGTGARQPRRGGLVGPVHRRRLLARFRRR